MPIYEYECQKCGHYLEALQKIADKPLRECPECGKHALKRLISAPMFRLSGSGWYETDFKSDQETKRNLADRGEKEESKTESKDDSKADAKSETKSDATKTEAKSDSKSDSKPDTKSTEKAGGESRSSRSRTTVTKPVRPAHGRPAVGARKKTAVKKTAGKAKR